MVTMGPLSFNSRDRRRCAPRIFALAVALTACLGLGAAQAAPPDQASDVSFAVGKSGHVSLAWPGVPAEGAQAEDGAGRNAAQEAPLAATGKSGALVINATFDSSITSSPNAAAVEAMINAAVAIYESSFNDPITVSILFRYATTEPDGSALPGGALATSTDVLYSVPWNTYINRLKADASTTNDSTANASLPASALSSNILPSSAAGRAIGLNTPAAMFADGTVAVGGPFDGIVTLNSSESFKFTRPPTGGVFDALRSTEHEIDEVLGLGSAIGFSADLRPQDLFSWSGAAVRNLTSGGSRYFSIDNGATNLVGFNQSAGGDFGDWLSGGCPQTTPFVQNAFSCAGQASDVTSGSPEGINLDVIGYDLIAGTPPTSTPTAMRTLTPIPTRTPTVTPTPTLSATPTVTLTSTPGPTPTFGPLDHFTCYGAAATKGAIQFLDILNPPGVSLVDEFGSSTVAVRKPSLLCAPTDDRGGDPTAPAHPEHLMGFPIKNKGKRIFPTGLKVVDEFNVEPRELFVNPKRQSQLLVPSVKSLAGPTPLATPAPFVSDHFQCYRVFVTPRTPRFVAVPGVTLQDQFGSMTVTVLRPLYLCSPVDENGEEPTAPADVTHLMCYQVRQTDEVKFAKVVGLFVNNQFGPEQVDARRPSALCVPALAIP